MRILYMGTMEWGSTSLQRFEALRKGVGVTVYGIDLRRFQHEYVIRSRWERLQIRLGIGPIFPKIARELVRESLRFLPDIVWVDQGVTVRAEALRAVRSGTGALLVHYTPDSLLAPGFRNRVFPEAIGEYGICFTTKRGEEANYAVWNAKRIVLCSKGYEPEIHRPMTLSDSDRGRFGADVSFIGQMMEDRARSLASLTANVPCQLALFGRDWEKGRYGKRLGRFAKGWVYADDYARAVCGAKICLGFLNREVGDTYTTRSLEIPACGAYKLAQRTDQHRDLFREGVEAEFFGTDEELVDKVRFYLDNDEKRAEIARRGHERVVRGGFDWVSRMKECLGVCEETRRRRSEGR